LDVARRYANRALTHGKHGHQSRCRVPILVVLIGQRRHISCNELDEIGLPRGTGLFE
jgi:hypothetical protein